VKAEDFFSKHYSFVQESAQSPEVDRFSSSEEGKLDKYEKIKVINGMINILFEDPAKKKKYVPSFKSTNSTLQIDLNPGELQKTTRNQLQSSARNKNVGLSRSTLMNKTNSKAYAYMFERAKQNNK
jgi:hypothetical protein